MCTLCVFYVCLMYILCVFHVVLCMCLCVFHICFMHVLCVYYICFMRFMCVSFRFYVCLLSFHMYFVLRFSFICILWVLLCFMCILYMISLYCMFKLCVLICFLKENCSNTTTIYREPKKGHIQRERSTIKNACETSDTFAGTWCGGPEFLGSVLDSSQRCDFEAFSSSTGQIAHWGSIGASGT